VVVSNFAGVVTAPVARVTVDVPLGLENLRTTAGGHYQLDIVGNPGQPFVLQNSGNLRAWTTVLSGQLVEHAWPVAETNAAPRRFYRLSQ
jgi:hypothetical protein